MDQNTSTTYVLPYSKPSISYIAIIINPTDYVFNIHKIHSQFWIPKCGYAPSKALPLLEGSPPINTSQPKYENIRKNMKNGKEYEIWTSIKLNAQISKSRPALPMVALRLDEGYNPHFKEFKTIGANA